MKKLLLSLALASFLFTGCDIDKKGDTELPEVDVDIDAEAGELPEFDVDWADINVGTTTKMVEVPKVVIVMEEEEVEVPVIDVEMPDEDKMERNLVVEAEVEGNEHQLEIKEIRAAANRLYVIATLEELETSLDGKKMRVQDQVVLNAPDLDVEYVIVGNKPDRMFNNQYRYVSTMNDLSTNIKNAKVIYTK
ncbi:hypothetical protein [Croceiramulus getboli]|nr:hypothetical protein P8624_02535 [Flavobacteriaceae bacterium YJPT1-3]